MRVSAKAEYACIAMLDLAANYAEPHPVRIKDIAETQGIPQRFLVQILLQLKTAGLVVSVRGASGGYQLARPPAEIPLAAIINAIDRAEQPSERRASPRRRGSVPATNSPAVNALQTVWREIQAEEQRILNDVKLVDLAQTLYQNSAISYEI